MICRLKLYCLFAVIAITAIFSSSIKAANIYAGLLGLNLSGAGFAGHVLPGVNGTNYVFPTEAYFQQWSQKGIKLIRFPILWERLQPKLNGPFDENYAGLIDKTFTYAAKYGVNIVLDLHNYARYRGEVIGTANVSYASYQDVMAKIAKRWSGQSTLYAYDIMNEPHDATAHWPTAAQYGINGVRAVDRIRPIMIEGNGWAEATRWAQWNDSLLGLQDPSNNLIFEAHTYFDQNAGGTYNSTDVSSLNTNYGVERVRPFVEWLKKHNKVGYIGEFGVPDNDARWLILMDNMLAYLQQNCIPATYWAAGPGWGSYNLSVEPIGGVDRPQWAILKKYVGAASGCSRIGPYSAINTVSGPVASSEGVTPTTPIEGSAYNSNNIVGVNLNSTFSSSEDKSPVGGFDPLAYVASYPDLILAFGINTLAATTHYQEYGIAEGRVIKFSATQYLANYADLRAAFGSDLDAAKRHYILAGYKEGRTWLPISSSSASTVIFSGKSSGYKFLFKSGVIIVTDTDFSDGNEGIKSLAAAKLIIFSDRSLSLTTFDGLAYIASYEDLIRVLGPNAMEGIKHYVENGFQEGRKTTFNGLNYIASYPDLIRAFGVDALAGDKHYIQYGYKEGRKTTFDPSAYLARYKDLQAAYGLDFAAAAVHYILNGYEEGRVVK